MQSGYLLLVCGLETYLPPPAIQPALLTQILSGSKCKYRQIGMSIEGKYRSGNLISKISRAGRQTGLVHLLILALIIINLKYHGRIKQWPVCLLYI